MNWLQKKSQANFELSIPGVKELLINGISRDMPGQQYLYNNPEMEELKTIRGLHIENVKTLLKTIEAIFEVIENEIEDDTVFPSDEEVEEEKDQWAETVLQDFEFSKGEDSLLNFLGNIDPNERTEFWLEHLSEVSEQEDFNKLMGQLKKWILPLRDYNDNMPLDIDSEIGTLTSLYSQFRATRDAREEQLFLNQVAKITDDIMDMVVEHEPHYDFPEWIDKDRAQELIETGYKFEDELKKWWLDNNSYNLDDQIPNNITENYLESISELQREIEHKYGFDFIAAMQKRKPDPNNYSYINHPALYQNHLDAYEIDLENLHELDLPTLAQVLKDISENWGGNVIAGMNKAQSLINMYLYAVTKIIENDRQLTALFKGQTDKITIDADRVEEGTKIIIKDGGYIPENAGDLTTNMESMRAEIEQQKLLSEQQRIAQEIRQEEVRRVRREKIEAEEKMRQEEIAKQHQMLAPSTFISNPEYLQQLRDLGISKRPFGHQYEVQRQDYPGGARKIEIPGCEPFRIPVGPAGDDKNKIPSDLLDETTLHGVGLVGEEQGSTHAFAWIGGCADYENKVMYIAEVQSDLMQRTVQMRDPEKQKEQKNKEMIQLNQQLATVMQSIQNAISSKQRMTQNLDRIRQENETLPPDSPKLQQNKATIDRLLAQLPNVPDVVDTSAAQEKQSKLQARKDQLRAEIAEILKRESEPSRGFSDKYQKWHDYKSKVENLFKDWIPILFNIAMREAKNRGFTTVRFVAADSLSEMWSIDDNATKMLFDRAYDGTAAKYNATPVMVAGKNWWEVNIPEMKRIANTNWLTRMVKKAEDHPWFRKVPTDGRYVWQYHLDSFIKEMKNQLNLDKPEFETAYDTDTGGGTMYQDEAEGSLRFIFNEWMNHVPTELKDHQGDLHPQLKQMISQYMKQQYQFDPYEEEFTENELQLPSTNEIEQDFKEEPFDNTQPTTVYELEQDFKRQPYRK